MIAKLTAVSEFLKGRRFWPLVLLLGLAFRVWVFEECRRTDLLALNQLQAMDMEKFLNWSKIIVNEDRWLSDFGTSETRSPAPVCYPIFHQAPLYPYFMAAVYKITGVSPEYGIATRGYWAIIIVQMLMGLLLLWPLHEILRRMAGLGAARWGTFLFVFHDASYFYEITLLREFLLSFLYVWLVHHLLVFYESGSWKRGAVAGAFLGLAWVCKANFMAMGPALVLLSVLFRPKAVPKARWSGGLAVMTLGMLAMVALPVGRNIVLRHREKVALESAGAWKGEYSLGVLKIETRGPYEYLNGNAFHAADTGTSFEAPGSTQGIGWDFNSLKELHYKTLFYSKDSAFARRVLQSHPGDESWKLTQGELLPVMRMVWAEHSEKKSWISRFWPMQWTKILAYVNGAETPNNTNINIHRKYSVCFGGAGPLQPLFLTETLVCAAFMLGVCLLAGQWRRPDVLLLFSFNLMYLAITVAFYYLSRFRYPCIPLMWVVGVAGLAQLQGFKSWTFPKRSLIVVAGVVSLGAAWPRDVRGDFYQENYEKYQGIRLADYYNYALGKWVLQKPAEALSIVNDGMAMPYGILNHHLIKTKIWALSRLPEEESGVMDLVRGLWDRCSNGGMAQSYPKEHIGDFVGLWSYLVERAYGVAKSHGDREAMQVFAGEIGLLQQMTSREHLKNVRASYLAEPQGNTEDPRATPMDPAVVAAEAGLK